jgi:1-acyl-sn-glycerol-3-phosphate acyltransferase
MKRVLAKYSQYCFQLVIVLVAKLALQPFTRVDATAVKSKNIQNRGYLIIANHRKGIDPFLICACLPLKTIFKILPVGFMTHNVFYDSPLRPLMWLAGSYPAKNLGKRRVSYGIDASRYLLEQGYSICIFPEGTRIPTKKRGEARWGVIKIHELTPSVPFMMAHIEYHKGLRSFLPLSRRYIRYKLVRKPTYSNPEIIMDEIFAL